MMTSKNFRLLSYDIDLKCYRYVGIQDHEKVCRSIVSCGEKLYLFQKPSIFQMDIWYEILDTKNTPVKNLYFDQWFVNSEGKALMKHYPDETIYLFDPDHENQLEAIQALD